MSDRLLDRRDLDYRYEPSPPPVPPDRSAVAAGEPPPLPAPPPPPEHLQEEIQALLTDLRTALASLTVPAPDGSTYTLSDLEQALKRLPDPQAQAVVDAWQRHFASPDQPLAGWLAPDVLQLARLYESSQHLAEALALPEIQPASLSPGAQAALSLVGESLPHAAVARRLETSWNQMGEVARDARALVQSAASPSDPSPTPIFDWDTVLVEETGSQLRELRPQGAPTLPSPPFGFAGLQPRVAMEPSQQEAHGQAWQQAAAQLVAVRNLISALIAVATRYVSETADEETRRRLVQVANGMRTAARILEIAYAVMATKAGLVAPARAMAGWFWSSYLDPILREAVRSITSQWLQADTLRGLAETFAFFMYGEQDASLVQDALWEFVHREVLNTYTAAMDRTYSLLGEWEASVSQRLLISQQRIQLAKKLQALALHIRVLREVGAFLEGASQKRLSPAQIRAGARAVVDRVLGVYTIWKDPQMRQMILDFRERPAPSQEAGGSGAASASA